MDRTPPDQAFLWKRIHAAIDRREDPLADPALAGALSRSPELAVQVVHLLENLESLTFVPQAPPLHQARRVSRLMRFVFLASAASIVFLAYATLRSTAPGPQAPLEPPPLAVLDKAPRFEFVIEHTGPAGYRRTTHSNDSIKTEFQPSPARDWLHVDQQRDEPWRPSPGDVLTFERVVALPPRH